MSITTQQAADDFGKVVKTLTNNMNGEIMGRVGISALTFIKERVIGKGTDADGKQFPAYSTKPTLVGCKTFSRYKKEPCGVLFGSKEKRKQLEWRTVGGSSGYAAYLSASAGNKTGNKGVHLAILPGGYRKIRQLLGAQVNHVDFMIHGDMWNDINVISKTSDHVKGIAIIGAKDELQKKKLAGNTKRKGTILDLSQKEQDDLKLTYNLGVLNVFKDNGLL
jgi:hypothetical protein